MMPNLSDNNARNRLYIWCIRVVKWIPVLVILVSVVWSYYAYVIQLCFLTVENYVERVFYLLIYHILFIIFCWAYWQTMFTENSRVPDQFRIQPADLQRLEEAGNVDAENEILEQYAHHLPITTRTVSGDIRYCAKCQHIKPDRAHHCSVCGSCILKKDHHCPWVNNCVAFSNYKYFILFLGYGLLYCFFIAFSCLPYFIRFCKDELKGEGRVHILFLFFIALMFGTSLISLFSYHCFLVLKNRSTVEAFRPPVFRSGADKDGFSLGKYNNFQEVFGDNRKLWFLPVFTSMGDGVIFPVRAQHQPSSYNSMGSTQTSLGDGVTFPQRCVDEDTDTLLGNRQRWAEEGELESPPFSGTQPH